MSNRYNYDDFNFMSMPKRVGSGGFGTPTLPRRAAFPKILLLWQVAAGNIHFI